MPYPIHMITIAQTIEKVIAGHPSYGEALREGIVNFSALARKMKPEIEEILLEDVTEGSIVMALRRRSADLAEKYPKETVHPIKNITVRSDIVEYAFLSTPELNKIHQKLLTIAEKHDNPFIAYGQGTGESTFDLSASLAPALETLTKGQKRIAKYTNLSVISIRMPLETVTLPGVYYPFVKAFAWSGINVYQIISYFTEVNFIIDDKDIERAFTLMKTLAKRAKQA